MSYDIDKENSLRSKPALYSLSGRCRSDGSGEKIKDKEKEMNKPYILCHMMMSLDGRIDWAITASIDLSLIHI